MTEEIKPVKPKDWYVAIIQGEDICQQRKDDWSIIRDLVVKENDRQFNKPRKT